MASEEGCVTITWEIKNFDLLLKEDLFDSLLSPAWKIEKTKGSTWWKLKVHNFPDVIFCDIIFVMGCSIVKRCEISIISSGGEVPLEKNLSSLDFNLQKNVLVGETGRSNLPNGTLTLCCRMREENIKISELRISSVLKRLSHPWNIEDSSLSSFHRTYIEQGNILFCVSLEKKDGPSDTWLVSVREVPCVEGGISSAVSFSMKACNGINLIEGPMDVTDSDGYTRFIMMPTKNLNIALQLELMIAYHRVCQGQLALHSPTNIARHKNVSGEGSCSLGRDFLHLYREGMLSDVTLHAEDPRRSFSAHRSILAARSPVFRAIFEESSGGQSVDMDGVDSETVGRMLVYLYGHSLEDLGWREASALYCAADKYGVVRLKEKCTAILEACLTADNARDVFVLAGKYAVVRLKEKCAAILEACLTADNARDVLVLADKYGVVRLKEKCAAILEACLTADNARDVLVLADGCSDKALVERVVLFILDHEEVVSSAQWEELERDNPALAAKIVKQLFLRRGKRMRVV